MTNNNENTIKKVVEFPEDELPLFQKDLQEVLDKHSAVLKAEIKPYVMPIRNPETGEVVEVWTSVTPLVVQKIITIEKESVKNDDLEKVA